jgi:hypothetical protein
MKPHSPARSAVPTARGLLLGLSVSLSVSLPLASGCAGKVDKLVVKRVVERSLRLPDVDQACAIGVSLRSPLAATTKESRPPHQALLIAEFTAALCDETTAQTHELDAARATSPAVGMEGALRVAVARDARLAADRSHNRAAARFLRALRHGEAAFGELGSEACPRLKEREELPFMLMLVSGLQVVLHDSAAGSPLGVPKETILDVARSAQCLSDEDWWYGPAAMQAAAWATIPGSAPEGTDPWVMLADVGQKSDATGIRVARALQVLISVNAGRDDLAEQAIRDHAAARAATPSSERFALFDQYALNLSRHQSDLFWMKEEGHRTPVFGELPGDGTPESGPDALGEDPFAEDPFGGDPFGDPPAGDPAPSDGDSAVPPSSDDAAPETP